MTGTPGDFLIGPGDITPPGGPSFEQESTVYIPPEPPGPTAEELADRAELEAAAAAGLALEDLLRHC